MIRAFFLAAILLGATAADARPAQHLRLEATTTAPLFVGGRLNAELPARLRLSTALGVMPRAYVEGINEIVVEAGGYDQDVAAVIEQSLSSSLVWRTHLGWRPFAGAGFYVEAGYGLVTLGGGASQAELIALAFDIDLPTSPDARYEVDATLHMFDAEIGWEWWVAERLALRLGLGGTTTIDAKAEVEQQGGVPFLSDAFGAIAESEMEEIMERYVHTPTLSLGIGYRFF